MSDLALVASVDDDNPDADDLYLTTSGDMRLTQSLEEEVAQHLRIRLRFFLGEWFLDTTQGIPFFRDVLRKNPSLSLLRALFRRAIQSTPGVDAVQKLDLSVDSSRLATLTFDALLSDGTVLKSEDFVPFVVA